MFDEERRICEDRSCNCRERVESALRKEADVKEEVEYKEEETSEEAAEVRALHLLCDVGVAALLWVMGRLCVPSCLCVGVER